MISSQQQTKRVFLLFPDWLNSEFLPENRRRLKEAHSYLTEELKKLDIPFLHRGAGFFIWADLSKVRGHRINSQHLQNRCLHLNSLNLSSSTSLCVQYLKEKTFAEELSVWRCFLKHKVLLSCGQAFSCESPGWFRIIFTDQQHKLQLGLLIHLISILLPVFLQCLMQCLICSLGERGKMHQ